MANKKAKQTAVVPMERVSQSILFIRDQKVILDSDLAQLYGVTTKRLNEQVKRNQARFPRGLHVSAHGRREEGGGRRLRPPRQP